MGGLSRKTGRCLAKFLDTHPNRETLCWPLSDKGASHEDLRIRRRGDRRLHGGGTRIGGPPSVCNCPWCASGGHSEPRAEVDRGGTDAHGGLAGKRRPRHVWSAG